MTRLLFILPALHACVALPLFGAASAYRMFESVLDELGAVDRRREVRLEVSTAGVGIRW